jgi:hypothetical protein
MRQKEFALLYELFEGLETISESAGDSPEALQVLEYVRSWAVRFSTVILT